MMFVKSFSLLLFSWFVRLLRSLVFLLIIWLTRARLLLVWIVRWSLMLITRVVLVPPLILIRRTTSNNIHLLAEEEGSPDTSEIWEVRGLRVARRFKSAKMALVTLSVLKSLSFRVCVMVDARPKRPLGSCVKINMAWKELGRLRPDWVSELVKELDDGENILSGLTRMNTSLSDLVKEEKLSLHSCFTKQRL